VARQQRADAHVHARLPQDAFQRGDVPEVKGVSRVVLRDEEHAAGVGADALDGGLDRLHAQRQERRIQIVEPARKEIGVDGRELEPRVAQVHG